MNPSTLAKLLRNFYWYSLWVILLLGVQHFTHHWCIALAAVAAVSLLTFGRRS